MPFWDRTLDAVFLTHPHADHLNGLISVLKRYEVIHYFTETGQNSTNLEKLEKVLLAEKKLSAKELFSGDYIETTDKVKILALWPQKTANLALKPADLDKNGMSLVQLLSYGSFKMLLTGDAEEPTGDKIASEIGKITVLKVPHHGSAIGMSKEYLDELRPDLAVISVGKNNKYGHPTKVAIDLLVQDRIKTLRTDQVGEVEIISDGKSFSVSN
jgi:competence protein ComEC